MSAYTNDFALVSEGVTDYAVLKNILLGYFKGHARTPRIVQRQPDSDATGETEWQQFGNWENVFRYLREGLYRDALEFSEYLIVQMDTDASEHANFNVPQQESGIPLEPETMVERVGEKIRTIIGPHDCETYGDRLIFAICVRELECWLLPLWETDKIAAKTTGCTKTLSAALERNNEPAIRADAKKWKDYDNASRPYRKKSAVFEQGIKNPSLRIFLNELDRRAIILAETE